MQLEKINSLIIGLPIVVVQCLSPFQSDESGTIHIKCLRQLVSYISHAGMCTFQILGDAGLEDRGGSNNSIQFINVGRMSDKSLKEYDKK